MDEKIEGFQQRLDEASNYADVWEIVKNSVSFALKKRRSGMMLFLDDLPLQIGAYHSVGTNNIVLNRMLVQIVETSVKEKRVINGLIYVLLLHEYLHSLGEYSESGAKRLVIDVSRKCFSENHIVTSIAIKSPWSLLKGIPLGAVNVPKRFMEIVKNLEKTDEYIV
jgi:hypothetical protein